MRWRALLLPLLVASQAHARLDEKPSFVALVRALGPAVVNVEAIHAGPPADAATPEAAPGHPGPRPRSRGQGTGFVIDPAGLILTNEHVVGGAVSIRVRLADERDFPARLVGRDERTDLALLAIEPPGPLPVAPLGDSDRVEIGEWVLAIGNPFGLDHTVTVGIVSAKGRRDVRPGGSRAGYYDFIQTDASINAGNSGGPLINMRGEVIGINTAINAQGQGIAFAIPVNIAKTVVPLLRAHGSTPRSWLGLYPQPVTQALERAFGLAGRQGALVAEVVTDSPAADAGLLAGDVIVEFDGRAVRRSDDLEWMVSTTGAGRPLKLAVIRDGRRRDLSTTLAAAPADPAPSPPASSPRPAPSPLGIAVTEINPGLARELGQPDLRGLVVVAVEPDSPAAESGVERGDLLLRVGDGAVTTTGDYAAAMKRVPHGAMIKLLVRRSSRNQWIAFPKR